jgi:hydroxyacylglutathione hydrolase
MKHDNRGFTQILHALPQPPRLDAAGLKAALASGAVIVDTRPRDEFCAAHPQGALSLPDRPNFSTRAAWFLKAETPIVLLAKPSRVEHLLRRLVRVGLDRIVGYIPDVASAGLPTESLAQMTVDEAQRHWASHDLLLLDVRQRSEFADAHIPQTTNVSAGRLAASLATIPKDRPILVLCAGGDRSVSAASALRAAGFSEVSNLRGGFGEWSTHGYPAERTS